MQWQETTLRKGTKKPKICRDAFITDSRGKWAISFVSNGRQKYRKDISVSEANDVIRLHKLTAVPCSIFNNCYTYRTEKSNKLIADILTLNRG